MCAFTQTYNVKLRTYSTPACPHTGPDREVPPVERPSAGPAAALAGHELQSGVPHLHGTPQRLRHAVRTSLLQGLPAGPAGAQVPHVPGAVRDGRVGAAVLAELSDDRE